MVRHVANVDMLNLLRHQVPEAVAVEVAVILVLDAVFSVEKSVLLLALEGVLINVLVVVVALLLIVEVQVGEAQKQKEAM